MLAESLLASSALYGKDNENKVYMPGMHQTFTTDLSV